MNDSRNYSVYPSDLDVLRACTQLRDYFIECKYKEWPEFPCRNTQYKLTVDESRSFNADDYNEFLKALSQYPHSLPISIHSHWKTKSNGVFACIVGVYQDGLDVTVQSTDQNLIVGIHEKARELFKASNPPQQKSPMLSKYRIKKSIFLAHRFDDEGKAVAHTLHLYLSALGFSVIEGEGYEGRDIPDKVRERIRPQDILLCVATPGDSNWILSEVSFALALGKYIIIMVQDGVDFNKGIVGTTYEHLAFPKGNVEKCFTDLLRALPR